jgi:hypothetical protein
MDAPPVSEPCPTCRNLKIETRNEILVGSKRFHFRPWAETVATCPYCKLLAEAVRAYDEDGTSITSATVEVRPHGGLFLECDLGMRGKQRIEVYTALGRNASPKHSFHQTDCAKFRRRSQAQHVARINWHS